VGREYSTVVTVKTGDNAKVISIFVGYTQSASPSNLWSGITIGYAVKL
jgi:hypothetical protein